MHIKHSLYCRPDWYTLDGRVVSNSLAAMGRFVCTEITGYCSSLREGDVACKTAKPLWEPEEAIKRIGLALSPIGTVYE